MRPIRVVFAIALPIGLLVACADDEGSEAPSPVVTSPVESPSPPPTPTTAGSPSPEGSSSLAEDPLMTELVLSLCAVQSALEAGDVAGAETTFEDEVHEPLHGLADDAESADRKVAADLLESKQRVEAGFAGSASATALARDLAALLDATRAAVEALDLGAPACPA